MSDTGHSPRNEQVVRELYQCIQGNEGVACFAALVAPDHIDRSNGRGGPAGFAAAAANLHRAYSAFKIELDRVVVDGDFVVVQWHETGIHTGQFFNLKPTHQPFESAGLNMYRLSGGMIVESWIAVDPRTIRAQQEAQSRLN